jgi:hypothetical protein
MNIEPAKIQIGNHDKGISELENKVYAEKNPVEKDLPIDEAIEKAKASPGAELIVTNLKTGKASVHKIFMEDAAAEGKSINVSELAKDEANQSAEHPLLINANVAGSFYGDSAFLVDEKNNISLLVNDPDTSAERTKLGEAGKYIEFPTSPEKKKIALELVKEAGFPDSIEKVLLRNIVNAVSNFNPGDYNHGEMLVSIAALNPGPEKTKLAELANKLNKLNQQYEVKVNEHDNQVKVMASGIKITDMKEINAKYDEMTRFMRPEITAAEQKLAELKNKLIDADASEVSARTHWKIRDEIHREIYETENKLDKLKSLPFPDESLKNDITREPYLALYQKLENIIGLDSKFNASLPEIKTGLRLQAKDFLENARLK